MHTPQPSKRQSPFDFTPRKLSDSPLTDHSDYSSPKILKENLSVTHDLRWNLFQKTVEQFLISQKMNRRGINWLLTVSWSKGYDQACIWNAILLFYAYKNNVPFSNQELQPIMIVCLQLSTKFYQSRPLETRDLLMTLSRPISRENIIKYEEKILYLIEFNLIIPHYLTSIWEVVDDDEIASKVWFICDLYSLNSHQIFFNRNKIETIINSIKKTNYQHWEEDYVFEIKQMLSNKQSRILYNKYGNKFDVDTFLNQFNFSF